MNAMIFTAILSLIGAAACGLLIFVSNRLKMSSRTTEAMLFGALVLPFLAAVGYFVLRPVLPAMPISTPAIPTQEQESISIQEQTPAQEPIPEYDIYWESTLGGEYHPNDSYIPPEYDPEISWQNTAPAAILPSAPKPIAPAAPAASVEPIAPSKPPAVDVTTPAVSLDPRIILWIWLAVAALALIKLRADYAKAMRNLKRDRAYVYDFEGVPVYRLDAVTAPMLAGILKPAIYIPTGDTTDLTLALRHELMHLKRLDIPKKLILEMIGALAWFNPLWHLAKRATLRHAELACDEQMLSGEDYSARRQYAETVMSFAGCGQRKSLAVQFSAGGETLKTRLENIMDDKPAKKRPFIVIAVIIALLLITAIVCFVILPPKGRTLDGSLESLLDKTLGDPVLYDSAAGSNTIRIYSYEIKGFDRTGDANEEMQNILDKALSEHFTAYLDGKKTAIKDAHLQYDGGQHDLDKMLKLVSENGTSYLRRTGDYSFNLIDEDGVVLYMFSFITDSPFHADVILLGEESPASGGSTGGNSTVGNAQSLVNEVSGWPRPSYVTNFDGTKPIYSGVEFSYSEYLNYTRYFDEYINEYDLCFDPAIYDHVVGPDYFLLRGRTYLYQIYSSFTDVSGKIWDARNCLSILLSREFEAYLNGNVIDLSSCDLEINGAPVTLVGEHGEFTLQRTGSGTYVINDEHGYLYTIGISPYGSSAISAGYGIYRVSKRDSAGTPAVEMQNALCDILEDYPLIQDLVNNHFDKFEIGSSFSCDSSQGLISLIREGWNLFTLQITRNSGSTAYHYAIIPYSTSSSLAAETNKPGGNYKVLQYSFMTGDPDGEIRTSLNELFGEYECRLGTEEFSLINTDFPIGEMLILKGENGTCTLVRNSYYTYTFTDESGEKTFYTIMPATWYSKDKGADQFDRIRATVMSWQTNALDKAATITNEWITGYLDDGTPVYDYPDWWGGWYLQSADMHIRVTELTPEIEEYISSRIDMSSVIIEQSYYGMNEAIRGYNDVLSLCQERMTDSDSLYSRIYNIEFDYRNLGTYIETYLYPDEDRDEMGKLFYGLAEDLRSETNSSVIIHFTTFDEDINTYSGSGIFIATHLN